MLLNQYLWFWGFGVLGFCDTKLACNLLYYLGYPRFDYLYLTFKEQAGPLKSWLWEK